MNSDQGPKDGRDPWGGYPGVVGGLGWCGSRGGGGIARWGLRIVGVLVSGGGPRVVLGSGVGV